MNGNIDNSFYWTYLHLILFTMLALFKFLFPIFYFYTLDSMFLFEHFIPFSFFSTIGYGLFLDFSAVVYLLFHK